MRHFNNNPGGPQLSGNDCTYSVAHFKTIKAINVKLRPSHRIIYFYNRHKRTASNANVSF